MYVLHGPNPHLGNGVQIRCEARRCRHEYRDAEGVKGKVMGMGVPFPSRLFAGAEVRFYHNLLYSRVWASSGTFDTFRKLTVTRWREKSIINQFIS